jgi:5-(carboxyamino)imidazole ribonucleotide mutase
MAIGKPGAANAALFAAAVLSAKHPELHERLAAFRESQQAAVLRDAMIP